MDYKLDLENVPLPKKLYLQTTIGFLLKANDSMVYMKTDIFDNIRNRVKNKVSVKNGSITLSDIEQIETFLENVEKMNILKYFETIL